MLEMSCVGVVLEFRVVCVEVCGLCESRSGRECNDGILVNTEI
jgi:hypothetical protein